MSRRRALIVGALVTCASARSVPSRSPEPSRDKAMRRKYYQGVSLAGATACSITHCMVIPLDVIKTRMQTDAHAAATGSLATAAAVLREAPGTGLFRIAAFFNGLPPTALGYFLQGATKFGGYELAKQQAYARLRAIGGEEMLQAFQLPAMLVSAATAEMAATVLLAPLEVLKLRMQTDAAAASRGVLRTFAQIARHEGVGSLYRGLTPIALRQVPYTVTKLVSYELFSRLASSAARAIQRTVLPGASDEALRPYAIVVAGLLAGAAAAVISHPADLLLTRVCGAPTAALNTNMAECVIADGVLEQLRYLWSLGLRGAYSGLAPRLVMTSAMTSIQFTIYEGVRYALGIAGKPPPKPVVIPA